MVLMVLLVVAAVSVVLLVLLCASYCRSTSATMRFDEAALRLFEFWDGHPDAAQDVPVKLQGVFWMAENPANEMCFTWMAARHDPVMRRFTFYPGGGCCCKGCSSSHLWTYGTGIGGVLLYLVNRILVLKFTLDWDEDYSLGTMKIHVFNFIPFPCGRGIFFIHQHDAEGLVWKRKSVGPFGLPLEMGTYHLKKVIDEKGNKLPAFAEMEESIASGERHQGWSPKSAMQFIPAPLCGGGSKPQKYTEVALSDGLKP